MSHQPPLPEAAQAPYPPHPAPIVHSPVAQKATPERTRREGSSLGIGRLAAGAAIGTAAVVAGFLFAGRIGKLARDGAAALTPKPRGRAKPAKGKGKKLAAKS